LFTGLNGGKMGLLPSYIRYTSLSGILVAGTLSAYVYDVQHLYHEGLKQHVFLLADYHEKDPISTAHRLSILETAKKHDAYLLVEDQTFVYKYLDKHKITALRPCLQPIIDDLIGDPIHFDPNNDHGQDFSIINPETEGDGTPLYLLTHMARHRGIRAASVERRQAEIISDGGGPISTQDIFKAYDNIIDQIAHYDDGKVYNSYYKGAINTYRTYEAALPTFFAYLRSHTGNLKQAYRNRTFEGEAKLCLRSIQDHCLTTNYQKQGLPLTQAQEKATREPLYLGQDEDVYEKIMCALYLFLIDTTIVHEIAQHEKNPVIMVYAGGAHIEEVQTALQANGYKLVDGLDNRYYNPVDLAAYFAGKDQLCAPYADTTHSGNYWLVLLDIFTTPTFLPFYSDYHFSLFTQNRAHC
jgi:hypothetical protein